MLNKGSVIKAKLIEAVEKNQWIVSFHGELLQVKNTTNILFKEGLQLKLQVVSEHPLELKVIARKHNRLKIDVVI